MVKCMYCHKGLEEGVVVDVCRTCGIGVWGERMFNAILQNMNDAREKGDLYQGSVTQESSDKRSPSVFSNSVSASSSSTPSLLQAPKENLGLQPSSLKHSSAPVAPSQEVRPESAPAPSLTEFTPQPSLTPPAPHLSSDDQSEKTLFTEDDEAQLQGPDSSAILQDVERSF